MGVCHVDGQLLQDVCLLGVKVESHLCKPFEAPGTADAISDEHSCHVTLVDQLSDLGRGGEGRGGGKDGNKLKENSCCAGN